MDQIPKTEAARRLIELWEKQDVVEPFDEEAFNRVMRAVSGKPRTFASLPPETRLRVVEKYGYVSELINRNDWCTNKPLEQQYRYARAQIRLETYIAGI